MPDDAAPSPEPAPVPSAPEDLSPPPPAEAAGEVEEGDDARRTMDWTSPRRIALIVAFGISLAFFLATAAGLLQVRQSLPVAAAMALLGGIVELPALAFFVAGLERRTIAAAPLLLLSTAAGLESYFVGGSVGIASSATLGGAAITMLLFLTIGHRAKESRRRRIRRVRRWSRNAAVAGVLFLLIAFGFYAVYTTSPPVEAIASGTLTSGTVLLPGSHQETQTTVTGAAGDVIYLLLGASNTSVGVVGTLLNSAGNPMANVTAGNLSAPNAVFLDLRVDPGTYDVKVAYPGGSGLPWAEVRWAVGDIPAASQAETGAFLSGAWGGFVLLVLGGVLWLMAREGPELLPPMPPVEGTPPAAESPASGGPSATDLAGAPPPTESSARPEGSKTEGAPPSDGSTRSGGVGGATSDEETT